MLDVSSVLIAFAALVFAGALAAGLRYHKSRLWSWADPIYYVVGAVGVILLFVSNQRTRTLVDLRAQAAVAQQKLDRQQAAPPPFAAADLAPDDVRAGYAAMTAEIKRGDYCKQPFVAGGVACVVYKEHQSEFAAAFDGFALPPAAAAPVEWGYARLDYCARGRKLIARAAEGSVFRKETLAQVDTAFAELAGNPDPAAVARVRAALQQNMPSGSAATSGQAAAGEAEPLRQAMTQNRQIEAQFALAMFDVFSLCSGITDAQRNEAQRYGDWQKSIAVQQTAVADLRDQIRTTSQNDTRSAMQTVLDFMMLHFWPFVLTAGLAIKFAKGVAALRG